ncbi:MAG: hypothetical protein QOE88_1662 [Verrucomicrobiota bacterium]|nr:hypothetical protein [Verrucomicrobiota bacterium]
MDLLREQAGCGDRFIYKRSVPARPGLFSARPGKECSLADCISFVAMNERVTIDALTSDHHLPREQEPLVFKSLKSVRGTLLTGDYSVAGLEELCSVERKSISDPVSCCMGLNQNYFETPIGPAERIPRGSPKSKKAPNQNFVSIKTATRRR